jgi:RNA polymerase sigma-70 factor, ECF subfamily
VLDAETESAILALARSAREADLRSAQDQLVRALSAPLHRLCLHLAGNAADAEDALQETLIAACRALPRFRGEAKLSTWVYRIAIRAALEVKSRRTRRNETSTETLRGQAAHDAPADEQADLRQRATRLQAAMEQLNPEQRAVISLFAIDGLGHQQIAEVLGIPEGTVWSRLHLARKKLSGLLAS